MDKVVTADMMRELDRKAIEDHGVPGVVLMENAGLGAFELIREKLFPLRRVSIFCGKGNNGGDGFVIARHLLNAGVRPDVFLLAGKKQIKGDAKINLDILEKIKHRVIEVRDLEVLTDLRRRITHADLIVDAILGTGLNSDVKGFYSEVIEFISDIAGEGEIPVFAVDIPSGLNSDTGQVMGVSLEADVTATFGLPKVGQLNFPGASLVGDLHVINISIPAYLYEDIPYHLVTSEGAAQLLNFRDEDSHKGDNGHLLILAGSTGKTGAATMAGESALRAGAGLATLAVPAGLFDVFQAKALELMTEKIPDTEGSQFGKDSIKPAIELLEGKTALALGPGIGKGDEVTGFVREIIAASKAPVVIDADGLNAVAQDVKMLKAKKAPLILTPHPGEMSRLMNKSTADIQADRLGAALEFSKEHDVVLVLKGAHTITAAPDGRAYINLSGNPGMASAGMGDVLTGIIGGLLSQGHDPLEAAVLGVFLHGAAGDLAASDLGETGIIAGDLISRIPAAREDLE
jgi:NAD(P)H-hydrate epimerase